MNGNASRAAGVSVWLLATLVGCGAAGPAGETDIVADGPDSIWDARSDADEAVGELPQEHLDVAELGEPAEVQPDQTSETAEDSDASQCPDDKPREGCPCIQKDFACCTKIAQGLVCGIHFGDDKPLKWAPFQDCGCWAVPQCQDWPSYDLCPGYQP